VLEVVSTEEEANGGGGGGGPLGVAGAAAAVVVSTGAPGGEGRATMNAEAERTASVRERRALILEWVGRCGWCEGG